MTLSNPKRFYSRFLEGHKGQLHFAAHSHHFWPDVTRDAQLAYWDDCAKLSDEKWNKIFSEVIPKTQKHIANLLNLKFPEQIVLAPNSHELSARLLSLFIGRSELKILTTKSEFHSWRRQFLRLMEVPGVQITQVDVSSSTQILEDELQKNYDLVFMSQVFFDSGKALTDEVIKALVKTTPPQTLFILDGYHGFAALPCDLSSLEGRIFYLGGGYKYGQGGEGIGFMVVPKGNWRPVYTGWFAEYGELTKEPGTQVGYSQNAMAFMGATQDPSGFYRFNAVWDLFSSLGISLSEIHEYVVDLQKVFIQNLASEFVKSWKLSSLFESQLTWHGHFLTFEAQSIKEAEDLQEILKENKILIDRRGPRLRFGFGLYQDKEDVLLLCSRLNKLETAKN
jgi:selenocysteine lyase/cysteine desulfurase